MAAVALSTRVAEAVAGGAVAEGLVLEVGRVVEAALPAPAKLADSNGNRLSKKTATSTLLKIVPGLVNALVRAKPEGCDSGLIQLLECCATWACSTVGSGTCTSEKNAAAILKIALNAIKLLRKFKRPDPAAASCEMLCRGLSAIFDSSQPTTVHVVHLREAIVLRLKLLLVQTLDPVGLELVAANVTERLVQTAPACAALLDQSSLQQHEAEITSALVSAAGLLERKVGRGAAATAVFLLRQTALVVTSLKSPTELVQKAIEICRCFLVEPVHKGAANRVLDFCNKIADRLKQKDSAEEDSTVILKTDCAAVVFAVYFTLFAKTAGDASAATAHAAVASTSTTAKKMKAQTKGTPKLNPLTACICGVEVIAAEVASAAVSRQAFNEKNFIKGTDLIRSHAQELSNNDATFISWGLTQLITALPPIESHTSTIATSAFFEALLNSSIQAKGAEFDHEIFNIMQQAGAFFAAAATLNDTAAADALEWYSRTFAACQGAQLACDKYDAIYKAVRSLYNAASKGSTAAGKTITMLELTCECAIAADGDDCVRKERGVIASLFSTLACQLFKAKRYADATKAANRCIATLPDSDLADLSSPITRKKIKELVYYGSKAASNLTPADLDQAVKHFPANRYVKISDDAKRQLLELQLSELGADGHSPLNLPLHRSLINELEHLAMNSDNAVHAASVHLARARIERSAGNSAVEHCKKAVQLLKNEMSSSPNGKRPQLADQLAHAYTWLGVCSREAGIDCETPFRLACEMWRALLGSENGAQHIISAERTTDLLHTLATLFGLLGKSADQLHVYDLIETLNAQLRSNDRSALFQSVAALVCTGHRIQQMGYVGDAAPYFSKAESLLGDECNYDFWLYFSQFTLAQGRVNDSSKQLERALEDPALKETAATNAKVAAFSAEIHRSSGNIPEAAALADKAFKLRMRSERKLAAQEELAESDSVKSNKYRNHGQWAVLQDLFDSLHQMGTLTLAQGFHEVSAFYLHQGSRFADEAGLPIVRIQFVVKLADVELARHDFDKCAELLAEADALLSSAAVEDTVKAAHDTLLIQIQIARCRANLAVVQDDLTSARKYLDSADKVALRVMDMKYIQGIGTVSSKTAVIGTPGEVALLHGLSTANKKKKKEHSLREKCLTRYHKESCDPMYYPELLSLRMSLVATRAWIDVRLGSTPSLEALAEIADAPVQGEYAAQVAFYIGCIYEKLSGHLSKAQISSLDATVTEDASPQASKELNYDKLKVVELRAELSRRQLPVSGKKAVLIDRLRNADAETIDEIDSSKKESAGKQSHKSKVDVSHALTMFERAFLLSQTLPGASLLNRTSIRLSWLVDDPWQRVWYMHAGLGVRARFEQARRLQAGSVTDSTTMTTSTETKRCGLLRLEGGATEFQSRYVEKLPTNLSVFALSVNSDSGEIMVARLHRGCDQPFVRKLPAECGAALTQTREQVSRIVKDSDAIIASGKDILSTEDEDEKEAGMTRWWEEREKLDRDLRDILHSSEDSIFGPAKALLLGHPVCSTYTRELQKESQTLIASMPAKVDNTLDDSQTACTQLLDALVAGVIKPADAAGAVEFFLGVSTDSSSTWITKNLWPSVERLTEVAAKSSTLQINTASAKDIAATPKKKNGGVGQTFKTPSRTKARQAPASSRKAFGRRTVIPVTPVAKLHFDSPDRSHKASRLLEHNPVVIRRHPVSLILDKVAKGVPFESMPVLRQHPVSREPSITLAAAEGRNTRIIPDGNTFFVLNPSRDLPATEERFAAYFQRRNGWEGTIGVAPTADQFRAALRSSDLFVYCGHGAGQDFFRQSAMRDTECQATTLLMGCSSGKLRECGDFEPHGIALEYRLAGAPAVVGNLWDVTDRDIDGVTHSILENWSGSPESNGVGLLEAVCQARERCRLRYLNGAALIVYGQNVFRTV